MRDPYRRITRHLLQVLIVPILPPTFGPRYVNAAESRVPVLGEMLRPERFPARDATVVRACCPSKPQT